MEVIDILSPELERPTRRSMAIDSRLQVFIALRFYATGGFYTCSGDRHGVSEASVCRVVNSVTELLGRKKNEYIKWPTNRKDVSDAQEGFFWKSGGFPEVVGALDCTHVRLDCCPFGENEHVYVNRKGWHSINVQLVCDSNYIITNLVARWAGSTHDNRIIKESMIGQLYEKKEVVTGLVLGDSGYQKQPWLMVPFKSPSSPGERSYNT